MQHVLKKILLFIRRLDAILRIIMLASILQALHKKVYRQLIC